jgi:hypothetical protein
LTLYGLGEDVRIYLPVPSSFAEVYGPTAWRAGPARARIPIDISFAFRLKLGLNIKKEALNISAQLLPR